MRLWHEALIPYLPRQQLLGLHREVCGLRGLGWGKKHATVDYVFQHPYEYLPAYHMIVMEEMERRGYHQYIKWGDPIYRGESRPPEEYFDVGSYWDAQVSDTVYLEHNDEYLKECLENLERKGIHIEL